MSIYGAPFEDENTNKPLDRAGLLLSLSDGLNLFLSILPLIPSNLSRFLITSAPTPQLFGSASLFGRVVRGFAVIRTAMSLATDAEGHTSSNLTFPLTPSEPVIIANTSVAPDGPIPHDFTFPVKPSLRPNPTVPAACDALSYTKTVAGLAHEYTKQAKATADETPSGETPSGETPGEGLGHIGMTETPIDETPGAPGIDPAPPGAPEEPVNTTLPYYMYGAFENGGYYQPPAEEEEAAPGEEKKEKKPREKTEWETPTGIISAGLDGEWE